MVDPAVLENERDLIRPITRGECSSIPRPCPFASCRYSLLAEVTPSGRVVDVFGDRDVEPGFSCALDVADTGGVTLERIGEQAGFTRERIRQLEHVALRKFLVRGGSALPEELGLRRTR